MDEACPGAAQARSDHLRQSGYVKYTDSRGTAPTSVRLDPAVEARLDQLAQATGRSKAYVLRELIEAGIDDLEHATMGAAVLERVRSGKEQTHNLDTVLEELGLDAADL
jgi:RHH-type rel operon transcriptional repressor/antitoxin RelB